MYMCDVFLSAAEDVAREQQDRMSHETQYVAIAFKLFMALHAQCLRKCNNTL